MLFTYSSIYHECIWREVHKFAYQYLSYIIKEVSVYSPSVTCTMPSVSPLPVEVVDLFCGIGGLSYGLSLAGLDVVSGYDLDKTCAYAYESNTGAKFFYQDIAKLEADEVLRQYSAEGIRILAGCAPCQPFSSYAFKNKEKDASKYDLLYEFGRIIKEVKPHIVTMENVPQIAAFREKDVLGDFVNLLEAQGYRVSVSVVYCPDYGIPQTRKRLVLLASRFGDIALLPPTNKPEEYVTTADVIGKLPALMAGEADPSDPLHRAKALSPLNQERMRLTPYGGSWKDWPKELQLECHKKASGQTFGSVYGRMRWEKPAPTMTTQCTGWGNGRFGHPEQNRAITPREAALIQTFPASYRFFVNEDAVPITTASRYIGNAVPPRLGEVIGMSIVNHLKEVNL